MRNIILLLDIIYILYFMFHFPNIPIWLNILVLIINTPYLMRLLYKNNSNDNQ